MIKLLKFNIQYIIRKKEFYFSILAILLINILHAFLVIQTISNQNGYIDSTYSAEYQMILYNPLITFNIVIVIIFPIICSIIFSDSNFIENKYKISNILFTRVNYKKNIIIRTFLSFILPFIICFLGFTLNYLLLSVIFNNGNILTYFQSLPFDLIGNEEFFLDNIRLANPVLFIFLLNIVESSIIGLLSVFAYSISFFIKQKVIIYLSPLLYLIISMLILSLFRLEDFSLITLMQQFSKYSIFDLLFSILLLIIPIVLLIKKIIKNKDLLI